MKSSNFLLWLKLGHYLLWKYVRLLYNYCMCISTQIQIQIHFSYTAHYTAIGVARMNPISRNFSHGLIKKLQSSFRKTNWTTTMLLITNCFRSTFFKKKTCVFVFCWCFRTLKFYLCFNEPGLQTR